MKKMIRRLLIFFIGVPIVVVIVLLLPYRGHLVLNIIVTIFSSLGAVELAVMLGKRQMFISRAEAALLGALAPALMTLLVSFSCSGWIIIAFLVLAAAWILVFPVFSKKLNEENYIYRTTAGFFVLIYPGFFLAWICSMGNWNGAYILAFLLIPMVGDGAAWAAGILFGKGNRGIIKVSPNKSIAGFIGELFASVVISTSAILIVPDLFIPRRGSALLCGLLLGLLPGFASILGDLCESAIKRSAECKDSGNLMPGRGGVLDTIDSIAMAAPAFYFTWLLLFARL